VIAAGPLRGPGKGGGFAAAGLTAPAKGTGPPLRPPGCCASPCGRRPSGPPLTPETTAAPRDSKSGQATGLPRPDAGAKASPVPAVITTTEISTVRGTPSGLYAFLTVVALMGAAERVVR
jgi:hypothetical protein